MGRSSHIFRSLLLALIFILLFLPLIQDKFEFFEEKPLNGDIVYPTEDSLTPDTWFSGSYQQKKEDVVNDLFGLRNFCVRVNNQVAFSLFKLAKANNVIVGKDNYLFEEKYITSYMGQDLISEEKADATIGKLKFIADTLAKMNKQLLLVFAAGKASFYPEFIPDKYVRINGKSNYMLLSEKAKQAGLDVIDVNAWFMAQKGRSRYPLYPQYGIHWSEYGSVLVADTLIKTIEHLRQVDLPNVYFDSLTVEQPDGIDYDIADGMNLLTKLKSFDMANVKVGFENDSNKTKPSVLVISDSFYWGIYDFGISRSFSNHHFWFYNKQVFPESFKTETRVNTLNLQRQIKEHDVIVLMATESNLAHLGWDFLESAEMVLKSGKLPHSDYYHKRVKDLSNYIKSDPVWRKAAIKNAKKEGVTLEVQIIREAEWVIEHDEGIY
jgi:hypothetical protein